MASVEIIRSAMIIPLSALASNQCEVSATPRNLLSVGDCRLLSPEMTTAESMKIGPLATLHPVSKLDHICSNTKISNNAAACLFNATAASLKQVSSAVCVDVLIRVQYTRIHEGAFTVSESFNEICNSFRPTKYFVSEENRMRKKLGTLELIW